MNKIPSYDRAAVLKRQGLRATCAQLVPIAEPPLRLLLTEPPLGMLEEELQEFAGLSYVKDALLREHALWTAIQQRTSTNPAADADAIIQLLGVQAALLDLAPLEDEHRQDPSDRIYRPYREDCVDSQLSR